MPDRVKQCLNGAVNFNSQFTGIKCRWSTCESIRKQIRIGAPSFQFRVIFLPSQKWLWKVGQVLSLQKLRSIFPEHGFVSFRLSCFSYCCQLVYCQKKASLVKRVLLDMRQLTKLQHAERERSAFSTFNTSKARWCFKKTNVNTSAQSGLRL